MTGPPPNLNRDLILLLIGAAGVAAAGIPEIGLAAGIVVALSRFAQAGPVTDQLARTLIQLCIVLLGFRMDLHTVARAGTSGLLFAAVTIAGAFGLGWVLGRVFRTHSRLTTLLSSGTAICGGSAVAAVGSVIRAPSAQMGVATAIVFLLNAAALYLFPILGQKLHLSPVQFGTWIGIAIHDVSSVVGAGAAFDRLAGSNGAALEVATVVKLTRVIWIIPICLVAAAVVRKTTDDHAARRLPIPWFIVLFVLAAAARTAFASSLTPWAPLLLNVSRRGMTAALFLIGAGLTWGAIRAVGTRPLIQSIILWVVISVVSLLAVRSELT